MASEQALDGIHLDSLVTRVEGGCRHRGGFFH
jgi:hypothetical protein